MRASSRSLCVVLGSVLSVASALAAEGWPIRHHDLKVEIDPSTAHLRARGVVTMASAFRGDRPLHFLLHRDLLPTGARLGEQELRIETQPRWRPRDFWERPDFAELGAYAIVRQHTVHPPEDGWPAGEFDIAVQWSGAVYDSLRPPDVAYGRGFESTTGLIDPRGAFLHGETFWIPWTSEDRFTYRLQTSLPDGWHSMSQGDRVEHGRRGGRNVTVWEAREPHELVYLIAGPYTIRERQHQGIALYTYTYANTPEDLANTYLDAAGRYLDLYGEMFGRYPFAKWAMVENWWQTGYGMPGFTLLGDRVIRLPFIVNTSYGHEILHCWWGNGVYVDYASGNWCEGLTAYGADYLYKTWESEAAARDYRRSALSGYLDFASGGARDFALRDFRERSDYGTQAIGYGKSLMVYHMLEELIGNELFLRGLQEFYRTHLFQPASWTDLAHTFSEVTGRDLRPWFAQWVDRVGALDLALGEVQRKGDAWEIEIVQRGEPYSVLVPVRYHLEGAAHALTAELSGPSTRFTLPARATAVEIDPDYHLFRLLYREEIPPAFSQVLGADSTLVVIGDSTSVEMAAAYRAVAEEWSRNQNMRIVDEADLTEADARGRGVFLLGPGTWAQRALTASTAFGTEPRELHDAVIADGASMLAVVRDPADASIAWLMVHAADAPTAAALGRKLPHYSRYSWLRFDGEENTGKGSWTVVDSPLRRTLSPENGR